MTETTIHLTDIQLRKMLLDWYPTSQTALLIKEILALREEVARLREAVAPEDELLREVIEMAGRLPRPALRGMHEIMLANDAKLRENRAALLELGKAMIRN